MQSNKQFLPLIIIFLGLNAFFLTGHSFLERNGIDSNVLIAANTLLFITNFITFIIQRKALQNKNPNVFVRSMMAGMMIKMFVVLGAFIAYVLLTGKQNVNKPAIYASIFLYFVYLAVEVAIVMKLNKQKNA
jgi:heme/copper-type cytochrome/quinol oxidase subunit 3